MNITHTIDQRMHGLRLDVALSQLLPDYSRARLSRWVKEGLIVVNQQASSPSRKVLSMDVIDIQIPKQQFQDGMEHCIAQDIPLDVVYVDDDLLIINKPAGLVVHPGAGNPDQTLVNALLHYDTSLSALPRAGIVHRLDKDTSGLLLIARHEAAYTRLVQMMQDREISRRYLALVQGEVEWPDTVRTYFGRHPKNRLKMSVRPSGKEAVTHYDIFRDYPALTLLEVSLETGRTHQIRVHMNHIGHPIVGDQLYGAKLSMRCGLSREMIDEIHAFPRQALHAYKLDFLHPMSQSPLAVEAEVPQDLDDLLMALDEQ